MQRFFLPLLVILSIATSLRGQTYGGIRGIALQTQWLYADSSFSKPTEIQLTEGEVFIVKGETSQEFENTDQNQTFKWFKAETLSGKKGFVFGDAVAVTTTLSTAPPVFQTWTQKQVAFTPPFSSAVLFIASVEGHDLAPNKQLFNPEYKEFYLVVANESGYGTSILCGTLNQYGDQLPTRITLKDITQDNSEELIIESQTTVPGQTLKDRNIEIWSFQSKSFQKIFEDKLSLGLGQDLPAPSLYKHIYITPGKIRTAYLDYPTCASSIHRNLSALTDDASRCVQYVTNTLVWDTRSKSFKSLYGESKTSPLANITQFGVALLAAPKNTAARIRPLVKKEKLELIQQIESYVSFGNKQYPDFWWLVRTSNGEYGYVPSYMIQFDGSIELSPLLNKFYNLPPMSLKDWNMTETSVFFSEPAISNVALGEE
jgi:hypothetical protein